MNKFQKKFLGVILSSLFLVFAPIMVNGENAQDSNVLYQKGIEFGAIDPSEVSKEDWKKQEISYRENYDTAIKEGILKDISYDKWLEANNYGQFPKINPEIFDEIVIPPDSRK